MKTKEMVPINIGISEKDRKEIVDGLSKLLADTYTLYLKTHNFHWNVIGPMFNSLHLMFEQQYNELALAVDLIAERVRALGFSSPGTYREFEKLTKITEEDYLPTAEEMIKLLLEGNETVIRTARSILLIAERMNDESTCNLLTQRMQIHEKTTWMLRSIIS